MCTAIILAGVLAGACVNAALFTFGYFFVDIAITPAVFQAFRLAVSHVVKNAVSDNPPCTSLTETRSKLLKYEGSAARARLGAFTLNGFIRTRACGRRCSYCSSCNRNGGAGCLGGHRTNFAHAAVTQGHGVLLVTSVEYQGVLTIKPTPGLRACLLNDCRCLISEIEEHCCGLTI